MKGIILTIALLAVLIFGAACGASNAGTVDLDDQQQAAAEEDSSREASWGSYLGSGI